MGDEWREVGSGETGNAALENARAALRAEGREVPAEEFTVRHYRTDDGGHWKAFVCLVAEETRAERLTLVSEAGHLSFEPPAFVQPGEVFWTWGRTLFVRAPDGAVRQVEARPPRRGTDGR